MPMYEYRCKRCDDQFETRQSMSEDPLRTCAKCDQDTLVKVISSTSFKLAGKGWYADGYHKTNNTATKEPSKKATTQASANAKPSEKTSAK